jgi:hypothetical protein
MDGLIQVTQDKAISKPWKELLSNPESKLTKTIVSDAHAYFSKKFPAFYILMKHLKLSGEAQVKLAQNIPLIEGDLEILLAIFLQN